MHADAQEVPLLNLPDWLSQQRNEGYTVVGLEQTAEAVSLTEFAFPKKTVIVVGREREGIPVEFLRLLDETLVIPQLGVIRSLNAHVSASMALYEYTKQHAANYF